MSNHDLATQQAILQTGTREEIIDWLCWNDRNGCYTDIDNELEQLPPLTLGEAREIMAGQIDLEVQS